MADWNPSLYLQYGAERTRPAAELLARIPLDDVATIADLGCGPGNSTALLSIAGHRHRLPGSITRLPCWKKRAGVAGLPFC
jgi:trans-aconitate 2-methyltransferase